MFLGAKIRTFSHSHNTLDMSFYIPNVWYAKKILAESEDFLSGIKEALDAALRCLLKLFRTYFYFRNLLVGRQELVEL